MNLTRIFAALVLILAMISSAYAIEITGALGATSYNPEEISLLFTDYAEKEGALAISYGSGETERELGFVYGTLTAENGKLKVSNGRFVSEGMQKVNISGELFYISTEEMPNLKFSLQKADYIKDRHAVICIEDCTMSASISPTESLLNIRGKAAALNMSFYAKNKRGEAVDENYVTLMENLKKINILGTGENFTITSEDIDGTFGKMKIVSEKAILAQMNYPAPYYEITAETAEVYPEQGANIKTFSRNAAENSEGISIFISGHKLFRLNRGNMFLTSEKDVYDYCNGAEEQLMGSGSPVKPRSISHVKENNNFFKLIACSHIDSVRNEIYVKPRTYAEENTDSEVHENDIDYPFNLKINLPAQNPYKKLNIGRFETFGNPSSVLLEKEGLANTALLFYKDNIVMPENNAQGNWFDIGISFSTFVFYENRFVEFECRVTPETGQYSCTLGGTVWATSRGLPREYNPQQQARCSDDSTCGNGGKCIERLCVRKSACIEAEGMNQGTRTDSKLDILFISNNYDEIEFDNEVKKFMTDSSFNGLLTVIPYSANAGKFWVWKMKPEEIAWSPASNMYITHRYANTMTKECPQIDHAVFLSANAFRSFAEKGNNVFISNTRIEQQGNGLILAHEFGHAFGELSDEYLKEGSQDLSGEPNCLKTEADALRVWTGLLGETEANRLIQEEKSLPNEERGCGGNCGETCRNYFKPSRMSIMNSQRQPEHNTYNDVCRITLENKLALYS